MDAKKRKKSVSTEEQGHAGLSGGAEGWDDIGRPDRLFGDSVEPSKEIT